MVLVICLVIEVTGQVFADARPVPMVQAMPDSPALVARLPLHKRGRLVSVSVQDHYVDVTTTKGRDVLLMRFGDAMAETQPVPGLQVHRSHWVALDQITAVRRKGDAAVLTLQHGPDIPVSRAFVPRLRDAGLLPRKGGPHG
jgi:DNA-binding LytR/AlgR family response regulator